MSSSDSPLNATHKSNCPLGISTWISNGPLKFTMSRTEFQIFSPKLVHPTVFPISVNANSLLNFLRPKALTLSSIPLFHTSHLVYQQTLQTGSYIYLEFNHFCHLCCLPGTSYYPIAHSWFHTTWPVLTSALLPAHSAPASLLLVEQTRPSFRACARAILHCQESSSTRHHLLQISTQKSPGPLLKHSTLTAYFPLLFIFIALSLSTLYAF